jgi:DUF4097 and DUF4098 domain-containing protein YvlB
VRAQKEEEAENWNKSTQARFSSSGTVLTLDPNTHGAGDHWVASDLDIALPRKASVMVATHHGDISIMGRDGNADVESHNGDVSVTDLNGALSVQLDHSSARISQIASDVTVQGRANEVSIEDVKGGVRLEGDFMESLKLSHIAKTVSFKSSRTDMDFSRLDGSLNLDSGDLEADNVLGPLRLRTRSKDITVNGLSGDVHVQNENGNVELHINKPGSVEVNDRKGDVRLFVPQKAGFQVDAQARDGSIQSDFGSLNIQNGDEHSTAAGSINGGGGARLVVNNEHGDIEIRSGVPTPPPVPAMPRAGHGEAPEPPEASEN